MKLYDIEGLATLLKCGKKKAEGLMKTKGFPSKKVGRTYMVEETALMEWFNNPTNVKVDYSHV